MKTTLDEELERLLWPASATTESAPSGNLLLAHYTSIGTLEKIIQNNEVWLSNPLHMNDLNELRFGMREGALAFRAHHGLMTACGNDEKRRALLNYFDEKFQQYDLEHAFDTYVFCVSEHKPDNDDGVLSMWRGYGASGAGVAIVFDPTKMEKNERSPLIIDKVAYINPEAQRHWINERLDKIAVLVKGRNLGDRDLFSIAHYWLEKVKLFSLFTKHTGFDEEREWRVVYLKERDAEAALVKMLGYAITNRGVEPKLKLKIASLPGIFADDLSLEKIVAKIILGPSLSSVLANSAVLRLLEVNGRTEPAKRVVASTIPFRP